MNKESKAQLQNNWKGFSSDVKLRWYDGDTGWWDVDSDRSSPAMRIEKRENFLMHETWFRCRDLPAEKKKDVRHPWLR